ALGVDDRGCRARLAPLALAGLDIECVMDPLQRAVPIPQHEVGMRGAFRRQILRQRLPLAARREHIEDRVQNFADVHFAPTPTAFGRRHRRFDQRPSAVAQITRVAQAMAIGGTAVFRLPHSAPLSSDAGARQGITTDSSDSTTLWIGSKEFRRHRLEASEFSTGRMLRGQLRVYPGSGTAASSGERRSSDVPPDAHPTPFSTYGLTARSARWLYFPK